MTVTEAVRQRRSIRAFLPTPVSETTLREVLDTARWAPSGSNVQAWKIVAVAGVERDAVVRMALESMGTPSLANHDEFPVYPPNLWEPLRTRRFALAEDMYRALGIPRCGFVTFSQHACYVDCLTTPGLLCRIPRATVQRWCR
jgi:nitroreductase